MAILQNQEDFKKMLANEGMLEAKAAERGVRGASVARALVMNKGNFGISQAMRSRALASAYYQAKDVNADVNRQLKSLLNRSYGKVAIQPVVDLKPPEPVYQNVGLTLMLGMGQALGAGLEGMKGNTGDGLKTPPPSTTPTPTPPSNTGFSNYIGPYSPSFYQSYTGGGVY